MYLFAFDEALDHLPRQLPPAWIGAIRPCKVRDRNRIVDVDVETDIVWHVQCDNATGGGIPAAVAATDIQRRIAMKWRPDVVDNESHCRQEDAVKRLAPGDVCMIACPDAADTGPIDLGAGPWIAGGWADYPTEDRIKKTEVGMRPSGDVVGIAADVYEWTVFIAVVGAAVSLESKEELHL